MDIGKRAYYSVVGKAVIGVIGGSLLLLVTLFRQGVSYMSNNEHARKKGIISRIEKIRDSNSDTISKFFSAKISDDSINNLTQKVKNANFQWHKSSIKHKYEFAEKSDVKEKFVFISKQNTNDSCVIYLDKLGQIIGLGNVTDYRLQEKK